METPKFLHLSEFVKPVDLKPATVKIRENIPPAARVYAYLDLYPARTVREISDDLTMPQATVRTCLMRMMGEGRVRQTRQNADEGERRVRWELGEDAEYVQKANAANQWHAKRQTVTQWEPHMVRDPLTAALFGPAKRQGEQE